MHTHHISFAAMHAVRQDAIKTSTGTDLGFYEWLGHLDVGMGWYLAPLATYWEWWECPAQCKPVCR